MATSSCKRRKKCLPLGCVYAWLRPVIVHFCGWQKTKLFEGWVTLEDNKGEATFRTTRRERKKRFPDWEVVRGQKPGKIEACESLKQAFSMSAQVKARYSCFVGSCAVCNAVFSSMCGLDSTRQVPVVTTKNISREVSPRVGGGGGGGKRNRLLGHFPTSPGHVSALGQPESHVKSLCRRGNALCGAKGGQEDFRGSSWGPWSQSQGFLWAFGEVRRLARHLRGLQSRQGTSSQPRVCWEAQTPRWAAGGVTPVQKGLRLGERSAVAVLKC